MNAKIGMRPRTRLSQIQVDRDIYDCLILSDLVRHCFILQCRISEGVVPIWAVCQSELTERLTAPEGLPWGRSGFCKVTVRWNTENAKQPFVELVEIEDFGW